VSEIGRRALLPRRARFALATSARWERAVRALPGGEDAAFRFARRYVAGTSLAEALECARRLDADGLASSIDFFGERVSDPTEADRVADEYVAVARALEEIHSAHLSIDLSHIGLDQPGDAVHERLERIGAALPQGRRIQVGAEEERRADRILDTVFAVGRAGGTVSATLQANLKRSSEDADRLAEAGVPVRLVKGAYVEDPAVARPWGERTDLAFLELAHRLHAAGAELAIATHDPVLREALLAALPGIGVEMLLGVRETDAHALARRGVALRIYVPYGGAWFRYAMRRWAESAGR
jgi:proline dehydrogenase